MVFVSWANCYLSNLKDRDKWNLIFLRLVLLVCIFFIFGGVIADVNAQTCEVARNNYYLK